MFRIYTLLCSFLVVACCVLRARGEERSLDPRYQITVPTNQFGDTFELVTINLEGELMAKFPDNSWGTDPAWSPDGTKVAFTDDSDVFTMNADGSDVQQLTDDVKATSTIPSWSPDGEKIAFQAHSPEDGNVGDIFVINTNGTAVVNLTENVEGPCWGPQWSPCSDQIAFGFRPPSGGRERLHVLSSDGSDRRQVSEQIDTAWAHPDSSPDGKLIATGGVSGDGTIQVFVTDSQGKQARQITSGAGFHTYASWSPDGRYIAYFRQNVNPFLKDADTPGDLVLFDVVLETHAVILAGALPIHGTRIAWKPFQKK